jgi:hypothetical protein
MILTGLIVAALASLIHGASAEDDGHKYDLLVAIRFPMFPYL